MTGDFRPLGDLARRAPRLLLFAGKGGVGKTTCAATAALALAAAGKRVLAFSTDPAHSLADSLGQGLGDEPQPVVGAPGLQAMELDAAAALAAFHVRWGERIAGLIASATYLSEAEAAEFVQVGVPGIDELMGLTRIVDLLHAGEYDHLVWDSAPTGHTLRLLELPDLLDQWVRLLAALQRKYLYMMSRFTGAWAEEADGDLLLTMKRVIRRFAMAVRDPQTARAVPVTIPEGMAVAEFERLVRRLAACGLPMTDLVVNHLAPEGADCSHCRSRRQRQEIQLDRIRRTFPHLSLITLPEQPGEVQGVARLRGLLGEPPAGLIPCGSE